MRPYQKVMSNSVIRPTPVKGVFFPPDNIIVSSGPSEGLIELVIARGDSDDAAGILLTKDEVKQLIESLTHAMGGGDGNTP